MWLTESMNPSDWRITAGHTQAALAVLAGVRGLNPGRTWKRWETGERKASAAVIALVERLSEGSVTAQAWAQVRIDFLSKVGSTALTTSERRCLSTEAVP